ncbi:MAG TPA: thioredoxin family protein [Steroidobacteraceae bacterium]
MNHGLGDPAPAFALPDPAGRIHSLGDFSADRGLLLAFICNHCPYVIHVLDGLVKFAAEYRTRGLATVAISANDVAAYPEDGPVKMAALAKARNFSFPYLYDETQQTAKAYGAACTPDFLVYDSGRRLAYHGRFDGSRPRGSAPVTGSDLRRAADAILAGGPAPPDQIPSQGCSLKWKPGNEPGQG